MICTFASCISVFQYHPSKFYSNLMLLLENKCFSHLKILISYLSNFIVDVTKSETILTTFSLECYDKIDVSVRTNG